MANWGETHRLSQDVAGTGLEPGLLPVLTITVASLKEEHPAVRGLNAILLDAMSSQASDVHLENTSSGLLVRLRLDGVLVTANTFTGRELADQIVSRVKVLSELDISERRIPQDGRFRAIINERDVDIDAYKQAYDEGRIAPRLGSYGYPRSLQELVEGVEDVSRPQRRKLYFLRRIPLNPFAPATLPREQHWLPLGFKEPRRRQGWGDELFDVVAAGSLD